MDTSGIKLFTATIAAGLTLYVIGMPPQVPISPAGHAYAVEPKIIPSPTPRPKPTDPEGLIRYFFVSEGARAVKVAFCESSLDPRKTNSTSSASGLFQILKGTWESYQCEGNPFNAEDNIKCAYKIYQANGWGSSASWGASQHCHGYK